MEDYFESVPGFNREECEVEYLLLSLMAKEGDYTSQTGSYTITFPGGLCDIRESALDGTVRNTYDLTGFDLTDHRKYALLGVFPESFRLLNKRYNRTVTVRPTVFVEIAQSLPLCESQQEHRVMKHLWSHFDFPYFANLDTDMMYKKVNYLIYTERAKKLNLQQAALTVPNSEASSLGEPEFTDEFFTLKGHIFWSIVYLYQQAPKVYDPE